MAIRAVVFTGGRNFSDVDLFKKISWLVPRYEWRGPVFVGCAKGLDEMVREHFHHREFKAAWDKFGAFAGPRRNKEMLEAAIAHAGDAARVILIAFQGGAGTANCIKQAKQLNITVVRIDG